MRRVKENVDMGNDGEVGKIIVLEGIIGRGGEK